MKNFLSTCILTLSVFICFSQNNPTEALVSYHSSTDSARPNSNFSKEIYFEVRSAYDRTVTKQKLLNAKKLEDLSPGYPTNWIPEYISASVEAENSIGSSKAIAKNQFLTADQKKVLSSVDIGSQLSIYVKYKSKNSVTDKNEINEMKFSLMIVPDREAEFIGGQTLLRKYLDQNAIAKLKEQKPNEAVGGVIKFTINEKGEAINLIMSHSTGDSKTDKIVIDAISKMPKWKPAENSGGLKVKQDFEFTFGNQGC